MISPQIAEGAESLREGRALATLSLAICAAGIAVIGMLGSSLLYFYIGYAAGTLGVLLLLLTCITSNVIPVTAIAWPVRAAVIGCAALAVRAFLVGHGPVLSFDLRWYADYVRFLQANAAPYTRDFYFPYPQGFLDFLLLFKGISSPAAAIHWSLVAIDCAVAIGLAAVVQRVSGATFGFWSGIGYALLPMPALETGRIGHFETLLNACVLVLIVSLQKRRAQWAAAAVTAATCLKAYPIVLAPVLLYTWQSKRRIVYAIAGGAAVLLLSVAPFWRYVSNIAAFWLGSSSSSPQAAGAFTANSLPAIAADFPLAALVVPLAEAATLLLLAVLAIYAVRSRRIGSIDARAGVVSAKVQPVAASGFRVNVLVPSAARFALAALATLFFVYGCYSIAKPWASSAYAYTWWYPSPLLIGAGVALAALSGIALFCLLRERTALTPVQTLCAVMAAVLAATVLVRSNVNPWYLMPTLVLLLVLMPARFAVILVGCACTFYASYNSTAFSSLGWNDVITRAGVWHASAADASSVKSEDRAVIVSMRTTPADRGRMVTVRAPLFAWTQPNTALGFDVQGDVDPTFHFSPLAFGVSVTGTTPRGPARLPVLIHSRDTSATNIGPIRFRIPLFALPGGLNAIQNVIFKVRVAGTRGGVHTLRVANVRAVNESRWDPWTAQATAIVVLLIACAAIALCVVAFRGADWSKP